jgi:hypothetical protein
MDNEVPLPPLVVYGVQFMLNHRFAVAWPNGTVSSFPKWEQLKEHVRETIKSGNPDAMRIGVFVCTKEWMQVPRPDDSSRTI